MSELKCPFCKNEIDSSSKFCCYCGADIGDKPNFFDKILNLFKSNHKKLYKRFNIQKESITIFNDELKKDYISKSQKQDLIKDNKDNFSLCVNLNEYCNENKLRLSDDETELIKLFINNYENLDEIIKKNNKKHVCSLYDKFKQNKNHYQKIIDKYKSNISYDELINEDKTQLKKDYEFVNDLFEKLEDYDFVDDSEIMEDFIYIYNNFNEIKKEINDEITYRSLLDKFNKDRSKILKFIDTYKKNIPDDLYIDDFKSILNNYELFYNFLNEWLQLPEKYFNQDVFDFVEIYDDFEAISQKINEDYIKRNYEFFSKNKDNLNSQISKYYSISVEEYIENKEDYLNEILPLYDCINNLKNHGYNFPMKDLNSVNNISSIFNYINEEFAKDCYNTFLNYKFLVTKFLNLYDGDIIGEEYIFDKNDILKTYDKAYQKSFDIYRLYEANELELSDVEITSIKRFISLYDNFEEEYIKINNEKYVMKLNKEFLINKTSFEVFVHGINENVLLDRYIHEKDKQNFLKSNKEYYDFAKTAEKIPEVQIDLLTEFINIYENFDEIILKMNSNYVNNLYNTNLDKIDKYLDMVFCRQDYYISNSTLKDFDSCLNIVSKLIGYCHDYPYLPISKLLDFPGDKNELNLIVTRANDTFIVQELKRNKNLFDNVIPNKPLDLNQRTAVIIDEDNTQIIAGAGCGKTLTLQAKVKYLTENKNIKPNEILALSFSNYSANDLKRKMNQIGLDISVSTFHSLGLDILRKNNVNANVEEFALNNAIKQYFISHLLDNEVMLQNIVEFFGYYMYQPLDKNKIKTIGEVYDYERGMDLETLYSKFKTLRDPTLEKTTLQGEKVKSLEERIIANFLFINGINYTYEKSYEPKIDWKKTYDYLDEKLLSDVNVPDFIKKDLLNDIMEFLELDEIIIWPNTDDGVTNYHPDFYLDDYEIYYEHFGVNRKCLAPWLPKKQSREYRKSMQNKRLLHKKYGTDLIETYSYYQSENRLLERLAEKLKEKGVQFNKINYHQFIVDLLHNEEKISEYWDFIKLVKTFINLFKGNGYTKEKFIEFRKINEEKYTGFDKQKHELFFDIVEDMYDFYYDYLKKNGLIDFNDMINDAVVKIKTSGVYNKFKYILVDEFQDTSHTRFNLLKALKNYSDSKIVVVGDDWQSIYRFTGCDIDLFTNFNDYFEDSKTEICYITNTYRNSQSLINASGNFVMKNDAQFKKQLNSKSKIQIDDTIKLYQYLNYLDQPLVFETMINDIYDSSDEKNVDILVLGRNRKDYTSLITEELFYTSGSLDDKNLKIHYRKNPNISIRYMTVHGSKGLEADNVILINLADKKNGFPNKIEDDSVLSFVKNEKEEPIDFAEERRLFYVGLTRTLKRTYLLAPKDKKSIFVTELMEDIDVVDFDLQLTEEDLGDEIRVIASTDGVCPYCGTGKINLKYNPKTGKKFFKCSNWPRCDWYGGNFYESVEELDNPRYCPKCGGLLVKKTNGKTGKDFYGCINYFPDEICRYSEDID